MPLILEDKPNSLRSYFLEIAAFRLLTASEEIELTRDRNPENQNRSLEKDRVLTQRESIKFGSNSSPIIAKNKMILGNLRLVISIAKGYVNRGSIELYLVLILILYWLDILINTRHKSYNELDFLVSNPNILVQNHILRLLESVVVECATLVSREKILHRFYHLRVRNLNTESV